MLKLIDDLIDWARFISKLIEVRYPKNNEFKKAMDLLIGVFLIYRCEYWLKHKLIKIEIWQIR